LDPGFIYYISRAATTGACEDLPVDLADNLRRLRENFTETSLAVGFGISTEEQAEKVAQLADGVVVGSKLVEILGQRGITGLGETALRFAERIRAVK
jgi:tryptophan synthase alpha chain